MATAVIAVMTPWAQGLWRWHHWRGATIAATSLVGAMVDEAVVLAQRLWQWCWCSDCRSVGAVIAAAAVLVQQFRWQQYWCSDCGDSGVGAMIAAALVQRVLGWRD